MIIITTTTGKEGRRHTCPSCSLIRINGVICHEIGCPDAWRDRKRECKWCGTEFVPEERHQSTCSEECYQSYTQ